MTYEDAIDHIRRHHGDHGDLTRAIQDKIFTLRNGLGQAEEDLRTLANFRETLADKAADRGEELYIQDVAEWDQMEHTAERCADRTAEFLTEFE